MTVSAKFRCVSKTVYESNSGPGTVNVGVAFRASYGPGNEDWAKATPSGDINLIITNPTAADQFVPGLDYALTFTVCPTEKPSELAV